MVDEPKNDDDAYATAKARARALLRQQATGTTHAGADETNSVDRGAGLARARARMLLDQVGTDSATKRPVPDARASHALDPKQTPGAVSDTSRGQSFALNDEPQSRPASTGTRSDVAPVSVAIATFNRADLLAAALKSCQEQTVRPRQVIVIDDGSDDATRETVGGFKSIDIVYLNPGRIGLGNARNLATALCQTKYLCVLDDDDIMLPNRIRDHMQTLSDGVQISHGGWINFNEKLELTYWPGKRVTEDVVVYVGAAITHGACCYETSLLREFPYRGDLLGGSDYDLAVRAIQSGVKCAHTGSYVLLRRMHEGSMTARHAAGQGAIRNSIAAAINLRRDDAEIGRRTSLAAGEAELVAIQGPDLNAVYSILDKPALAMRLGAFVPRRAGELFSLLDSLGRDWAGFDIVDAESALTSAVMAISPATTDISVLSAAEIALRRRGVRCAVYASDNPGIASAEAKIEYEIAPGSFRVSLASDDLRQLYRAYRNISSRRSWIWYLQARRDAAAVRGSRYTLVTAPFKLPEGSERQHAYVEDIRNLIGQHTDLGCEMPGLSA